MTEDERERAYLYSFSIQNKQVDQINEQMSKDVSFTKVSTLYSAYFLIFTKEARQYFQGAYERSRLHYISSTASSARRDGVRGGGGGAGAF